MTNFVRRRIYARSAPPAADAIHIDGQATLAPGWIDEEWPELPWTEVWKLTTEAIIDAVDASTGFWPAWGEGVPAWDVTPDDDVSGETALEDPLGLFPGVWTYVVADVAGAIVMSDGSRWTVSVDETPHILVESPYAASDEPSASIRELALYIGATPAVGHEADPYLPMANVSAPGALQAIDRISIVPRSAELSGKVRFLLHVGD